MNAIGLHAGQAGQASRETQVQIQIDRLQCAAKKLNEAIGAVTSRLTSVLRSEPPAQIGGGVKTDAPRQQLVGLASSIESEVDALESMARELIDILDRLEL